MGPLERRLLNSGINIRGSATGVDLVKGGKTMLVNLHIFEANRVR